MGEMYSSPTHSLTTPNRSISLESPHQSLTLSTLHASSSHRVEVKNLENGSSGATVEGADEEERKLLESQKKRSKNWTRPETLLLIRLRTEFEPRFAKAGRKTELWDEIAAYLQKENFARDTQQCRDKWEKLTASYNVVRDGVKDKAESPFFDELHVLMARRAMKRDREKQRERDRESTRELFARGLLKGSAQAVGMEEDDVKGEEPSRKRMQCEGTKCISVTEVEEAVKRVLETVVARQQDFFRELLDAMERKELMREQIRLEKEEKWRAEEREQRGVFNNAMIHLIHKLVGDQSGASSAVLNSAPTAQAVTEPPPPAPGLGSPEDPQGANKRRGSKNWKRAEVLQLIKLRAEMDSQFSHSKNRGGLWDELAERLSVEGFKRDGKPCREKWDKLVAQYKDVIDGRRDQRDCPYYPEVVAFFGRSVEGHPGGGGMKLEESGGAYSWASASHMTQIWCSKFAEYEVKPTVYMFSEVRTFTGDFHPDMKLGKGHYGYFANGTQVAVKQLFTRSQQSLDVFPEEIVLVAAMKHLKDVVLMKINAY